MIINNHGPTPGESWVIAYFRFQIWVGIVTLGTWSHLPNVKLLYLLFFRFLYRSRVVWLYCSLCSGVSSGRMVGRVGEGRCQWDAKWCWTLWRCWAWACSSDTRRILASSNDMIHPFISVFFSWIWMDRLVTKLICSQLKYTVYHILYLKINSGTKSFGSKARDNNQKNIFCCFHILAFLVKLEGSCVANSQVNTVQSGLQFEVI